MFNSSHAARACHAETMWPSVSFILLLERCRMHAMREFPYDFQKLIHLNRFSSSLMRTGQA